MKILYIVPSFNIYGGTPKKTLDLMKSFKENSAIYIYSNQYLEFKTLFEETGGKVFIGNFGRNFFKHLRFLLKILDEQKIDIVQTQFSAGETLGYLIKLFRPKIKLIIAFVGVPEPLGIKKFIVSQFYKKADRFVFISEYVKREKILQFPIINKKESKVIFNGTQLRPITKDAYPKLSHISLLSISGLIALKNINILVEAMNIIVNDLQNKEVYLYVAGDGEERNNLEEKIKKYSLEKNVFLLGYQKNIGALLDECDIFLHPCYAEGFGIAVAEAMMAAKPIIASNEGAMPELIIQGEEVGILVDKFDAQAWAISIMKLIENQKYASKLGSNAKVRAENEFSKENFVSNYKNFYSSLMEKK
ncbi:MAG: glycosyltransferase family 4 protein [Campylobacterota bacterium]|nr:glycosyltransferase family 4 protein [Campylobacterota bacterium]